MQWQRHTRRYIHRFRSSKCYPVS